MARSRAKNSAASAADRRSGSVTISISGTPLRLKSRWVRVPESANPSWSDLPASSSMWTRVMPDPACAAAGLELHGAAGRQRPIVLGDLIALGQVRIEVVLAREHRRRLHRAAERMRRPHRELDGALVQDRQRARQSQADRADVGVRRRSERRAAAAEDLAGGQQLAVDFKADNWLERRHSGRRLWPRSPRLPTTAETGGRRQEVGDRRQHREIARTTR